MPHLTSPPEMVGIFLSLFFDWEPVSFQQAKLARQLNEFVSEANEASETTRNEACETLVLPVCGCVARSQTQ